METFTQTSNEPYDRHHYKLHFKDNKTLVFDDYEQLRAMWFQWAATNRLSHVDVLDIKQQRKKGKGFN